MGLLELVIVIILLMWLLGAFVYPIAAVGGAVHVLLVIILVLVVVRLLQGRL